MEPSQKTTIDFKIRFAEFHYNSEPKELDSTISAIIKKLWGTFQDLKIHFSKYEENDFEKFPPDQIQSTQLALQKILQEDFSFFSTSNPTIKEAFNEFTFKSLSFEKGRVHFQDNIGKILTKFFKECDFTGLLWVIITMILDIFDNYSKHNDLTQTNIKNYLFERRFMYFIEIVHILAIMMIIQKNHSFAFNYVIMAIIGFLVALDPFDKKLEKIFPYYEDRMKNLRYVLYEKCPYKDISHNENYKDHQKEIFEIVFKNFPKIQLGKSYFEFLKNVLETNLIVFCQINNPKKEAKDLNNDLLDETKQAIDNILKIMPEQLYLFSTGLIFDKAITLYNGEVGISKKLIENAQIWFQGKYFLLMALYHEIAHVKGIFSYKSDNSFFNSPETLLNEAGTISQIKSFGAEFSDVKKKGDESFYEDILIRITLSQNLQEIKSLSQIDNFILEDNSSGKSDLGSVNLGMNDGYYDQGHGCMYSSIRNATSFGMINLLMKTYKG